MESENEVRWRLDPMNWPAALFTVTVWMLAASFWQFYRPMPETISHRMAGLHIFRDIAPALLLGLLVGIILE
jgi:hypothetical protein